MRKEGGVSRRDFLKYCAATAALFGLSELEFVTGVVHALETSSKKPRVIWLEGQSCTGCTIALTQSCPPIATIVLDKISLRYHGTIMAAAGNLSEKVLHDTIEEGGFVLMVEGSIPTADDRYCIVGGKPKRVVVEKAAEKAVAIIAVGACASYGGIPAATPSMGAGLNKILPGKTVINLSTCPVHPDHLAGTILYFLATGKAPALDKIGRPLVYFGQSIHDNCRRLSHFYARRFLVDWNDPKQKDWCVYMKGCKGPFTSSDCAIRRWNAGINFCIDCGAPCQGCAEPGFYAEMTPLYMVAEDKTSKDIWAIEEVNLLKKA